uniref:Uncharacterized protein n=1 Tax=Anopheles albimanus TaxID=7167 RepID=A0A182FYW3_ANOAL
MGTLARTPVSQIMKNQAERAEPDNGINARIAARAGKFQSDRLELKKGITGMPVPQITKSRVELKLGTKHQSQQPTPDSTSTQQRHNPQQQTHAQEKVPLKSNSDMMSVKSTLLPSLNDSLSQVRGNTFSAKESFYLDVHNQIDPLRSKIVSIAKQAEQGQNRIDLEKAKAERRKMDEDLLNIISMECVLGKIAKMNEQFLKEWNEIDKNGSQS